MKLADSITADILQEIKNQNYVPGDKIPNEFELAEKYQVSRTTIREAIKQLCSRNVLEIRRGNGTYVCKKLGRVTDPLGFEFTKDNAKLVKDLCEFRLITEPSFAYYAAERRTDDEAAAIIDVCTIIEDLIKNKDNLGGGLSRNEGIKVASGKYIAFLDDDDLEEYGHTPFVCRCARCPPQ